MTSPTCKEKEVLLNVYTADYTVHVQTQVLICCILILSEGEMTLSCKSNMYMYGPSVHVCLYLVIFVYMW